MWPKNPFWTVKGSNWNIDGNGLADVEIIDPDSYIIRLCCRFLLHVCPDCIIQDCVDLSWLLLYMACWFPRCQRVNCVQLCVHTHTQADKWLLGSVCTCMSVYMMVLAFDCVCVCVCGDGCPQHLSGNLAASRPLPMRAGKHSVMDLTLHTSAKHNVNLFPSLHSASRSSLFPSAPSVSLNSEPLRIWCIMYRMMRVTYWWHAFWSSRQCPVNIIRKTAALGIFKTTESCLQVRLPEGVNQVWGKSSVHFHSGHEESV